VEVNVRYQLNGDDGLECMRVHSPSFRTNVVVSSLASLALVAIGSLMLMLPGNHALAWASIGFGVAALAIGSLHRVYLVRRLRRTWNQSEPTELRVRESGFTATANGAQSEVAWSRFVRLREAENHFLLYRSTDLYAIVPKRGFANQADIDMFRDMATRGIAHA